MGSRKLGIPEGREFKVSEISDVKHDLKKIRVTNFETAYELFKKALPQMYLEREWWKIHRIYLVSGLKCSCEVYIAKKLSVPGIKGNDHFRVVFRVVHEDIIIIEVFQKSQKDIEDKKRICDLCK